MFTFIIAIAEEVQGVGADSRAPVDDAGEPGLEAKPATDVEPKRRGRPPKAKGTFEPISYTLC